MRKKLLAEVDAADMRRALKQLTGATEARATIPILDTTKLAFGPHSNTVILTRTNLDMEIETRFDAEVFSDDGICIRNGVLDAFFGMAQGKVRMLREQVAADSTTLHLETEDGMKVALNDLYPVMDFPLMTSQRSDLSKRAKRIEISEAALWRGIDFTFFCVSTEETRRYYLNGIYFTQIPGQTTLRMVATDGHRLGLLDFQDIEWPWPGAIVPRGLIETFRRMLSKTGNRSVFVRYIPENPVMMCEVGDTIITAKLIDGTYPDYTRVIPEPSDAIKFRLTRAQIMRLNALSGKGVRRTRVCALKPAHKLATLEDVELGIEASVPIESEGTGRKDKPVGFNIRYLADFAKREPVFTLSCSDPGAPAVVRGEDADGFWVQMPMRV